MFQVLIADDENSVVRSLTESISWGELGLEVAATASDGYEVLSFAEKNNIDVAILDIRMPGANGLELCDQLKRLNAQIQLIIISGYAEFAYAEKAIQYGVLGYCLKPLEYTQITRYLRKAVQNLMLTRHMTVRVDLLEILENGNSREIERILSELNFEKECCYVAVSVGERRLEELAADGMCMRIGRGQWGYLMRRNQVDMLGERLSHVTGWQGIGYLSKGCRTTEIYDSLEECTARAFQFFVNPEQKICAETDSHKGKKWLDIIQYEMRENHWKQVIEILEEIHAQGGREFGIYSALRLCNMIFSSPLFQENDSYVYSIEQLVIEYGTFMNMLVQLEKLLKETLQEKEADSIFTNTAFLRLMKYVNANYRGEISLTSAAQVLHMNPNYVSQMFKKGSGVTFVQYVTQKRIEDAKNLLLTTEKPLTEIAIEIGFNDYFHFIKTFKKITGKTPGQFRTQS